MSLGDNKIRLTTKQVTIFLFILLLQTIVIFFVGGYFLFNTKYFDLFFNISLGIAFLLLISLIFIKLLPLLIKINPFGRIWLAAILIFSVGAAINFFELPGGSGYLGGVEMVGTVSFIFWIALFLVNKFLINYKRFISLTNKGLWIVFYLVFTYAIIYASLFRFVQIEGSSMVGYQNNKSYPLCVICKDFRRGDVVVYLNKVDTIGRIVGLPNETIEVEKNYIIINGKKLPEDYADWSSWITNEKVKIKLGKEEYLVLFDKRKSGDDEYITIDSYKMNKSNLIGKFLQ